jgi:hypothetical protein
MRRGEGASAGEMSGDEASAVEGEGGAATGSREGRGLSGGLKAESMSGDGSEAVERSGAVEGEGGAATRSKELGRLEADECGGRRAG